MSTNVIETPERDHVARAALAAALLPIIVTIVRNLGSEVQLGDAGYFVARSRDVLTTHHPFVGAYSSGSAGPNSEPLNNLGPLQLDLLAPFTKLDPLWGAVLGTGALSAASVVVVWLVARRMFTQTGVVAVMLATLALEASIGTEMMIDARQQATLILPFWSLLWCAAGVAAGVVWALPALAFVASLTTQTHLSYVVPTFTIVTAALLIVALDIQPVDRRRLGRPLAMTAVVVVVCWAQTLWDQFAGAGNVSRVAGASGGTGIGLRRGAGVLTESVLLPPFGSGGHLDRFLDESFLGEPTVSTAASIATMGLWIGALLASFALARRREHSASGAVVGVAFAALVGGLAAAAGLPPHPLFGIVPQNYFWMWPIGAFAICGIIATVASVVPVRWNSRRLTLGLGAASILAGLLLIRSTDYWDDVEVDETAARSLLDAVDADLAEAGIDGPVVLDFLTGVDEYDTAFIFLAELDAAGIEYRFPAGALNLERFGEDRCADGSETWFLTPLNGVPARVETADDELVLIDVDLVSDADVRELAELDTRIGDAIRTGDVTVNEATAAYLGVEIPIDYRTVRSTDGRPATGLTEDLGPLYEGGMVDITGAATDDFDRWLAVSQRVDGQRLALIATPADLADEEICSPGR